MIAVCPFPGPAESSPSADLPPVAPSQAAQEQAAAVKYRVPSKRDFEIFEEVTFHGVSQYELARKYRISQPRVHQILAQIAGWVADNTPGFAASLSVPQRLRLLKYTMVRKLQYHEQCLMGAWRKSGRDEMVERTTVAGTLSKTVRYKKRNLGDPRYLAAAQRTMTQLLKIEEWSPPQEIPAAPQDSPYWQMSDEEADAWEEADEPADERPEQAGDEPSDEETDEPAEKELPYPKKDLSAQDVPATWPQLTPAQLASLTPEDRATYEAQEKQFAELRQKDRELKTTLSLGTGPLLGKRERRGRDRDRQRKKNARREFLGG